jgi:hypothetical protein
MKFYPSFIFLMAAILTLDPIGSFDLLLILIISSSSELELPALSSSL